MIGYLLTEDELKALEANPAALAERLKAWRAAIDEQKARHQRTQDFIRAQSHRSDE